MKICKCGCGKEIIIKPYHKYRGIPNFICGHSTLGTKASEKTRTILSDSHKGQSPWNKGKIWSEEHKEKLRVAHRCQFPNRKGSVHRPESIEKMRLIKLGKIVSDQTKKRMSDSQKKKWQTPGHAEKVIKSLRLKPNKKEIMLIEILNSMYPKEWKFVGDGQVIIAGKCPDFINCNGQKKIIELFGNYWHRGEDPQNRINAFNPFGYETLVIWESELKDIETLTNKLREFCNENL